MADIGWTLAPKGAGSTAETLICVLYRLLAFSCLVLVPNSEIFVLWCGTSDRTFGDGAKQSTRGVAVGLHQAIACSVPVAGPGMVQLVPLIRICRGLLELPSLVNVHYEEH